VIILDTNVVSESIAAQMAPAVVDWLDRQQPEELWLTAITVSELLYGVFRLPAGRRRERLEEVLNDVLNKDYRGRVLPFDADAAVEHARLVAKLRARGAPTGTEDAMIAAIALTHGAKLATRNVKHFTNCGVALIDPWSG
jgi:predicted nucleic acid-binding protein